jgi:hypothetical protein
MRTKIIPILSFIISGYMFLSGCDDSTYKEYRGNVPLYMTYEELRASITKGNTQELMNPGKIYFKDKYIFIVEERRGIHIYDDTDPAAPVKKDFISIPGVVDISISGSTLYADSYIDLVVLDVSDIMNVHEINRVKGILPYTLPPTGNDLPYGTIDETQGVVKGWQVQTIRERISNITNPYPYPIYYDNAFSFLYKSNAQGASAGVSGSGVGLGGSMARFGILGNTLYAVSDNTLKILDISDKTNPSQTNSYNMGGGIETMFLTDTCMFLGMNSGMMIYNISIPESPVYKAFYSHVRACDPVIVDDTLAYVTLRTGTTCGGGTNTLDVINLKKITQPVMISSYPLVNPQGLSKDSNILFVCDGTAGLKIYDASNPLTISGHLLKTYSQINAWDAIAVNGVLFMIGSDGLYQYDYSTPTDIKLLSKIGVVSAFIPD